MKQYNIKELRENIGLTQKEASEKLQIKKNYLSMIECATRNPSDNLKEKMSKLYGVTIYEIFSALKTTKCNINKAQGDKIW